MKHATWMLALGALAVLSGPTAGHAQNQKTVDIPVLVEYDHSKGGDAEYKIRVSDDESFRVLIKNTCPKEFGFEVKAVPGAPPRPEAARGCTTSNYTFPITHQKENGGYIVQIRKKKEGSVTTTGGAELKNATLIISVITRAWAYDFSSGFSLSRLTDPEFGLVTREVDGEEKLFAVRDLEAEDDVEQGLVSFINIFHKRVPSFGLSFGLGIGEDAQTTYYVGPSWRWGDHGALTAGIAFGEVDRLKAGTDLSQPVEADFLQDLGSHTKSDFFVAFTYSFLGGRDRLEKKFQTLEAGSGQSTGTSGGQTPGPGTQPPRQDTPPADTSGGQVLAAPANFVVQGAAELEADGAKWKVTVSWDAVDGASAYELLQNTTGCEEGSPAPVKVEGTSHPVTGLLADAVFFRVRAVKAAVAGLDSQCLKVTKPAQ